MASGGFSGKIVIWDVETGRVERKLNDRFQTKRLCVFPGNDGRLLLATGGDGTSVRIWDLESGARHRELDVPLDSVQAMCAVTGDGGRTYLATGGIDRIVSLWNPETGARLSSTPVYHRISALCSISRRLFVGLEAGLLALDIDTDALEVRRVR